MIATASRVLRQLRHDPRTVALMIVVPTLLMVLLRYVLESKLAFSHVAPKLLGIFPFLLMFLVTSITTLRERASGTLERLMTTPLAKLSLLAGYGLAFSGVAAAQVAVTAVDALLGVALGLLASAFARTEFQAIQMMPVVVLPQTLLCGLFSPREGMATILRWASDVLPVPYAVEALQYVATARIGADFARDLLVLVCFVAGGVIAAAATLRRTTA